MEVESITTANNKIIAKFMGIIYRCASESLDYHYKQRMNDDGSPYIPVARLIESEWLIWKPHNDYNDLMEVLTKLHSIGVMYEFKNKGSSFNSLWYTLKLTYFNEKIPAGRLQIYSEKASPLETLYCGIVEFIRWYLEFKNKTTNNK